MADDLQAHRIVHEAFRAARPQLAATRAHVDEDTWVRLAARELTGDARAEVFDHVVVCDECARVWKGIQALQAGVDAGGSRTAPGAFGMSPLVLAIAAALALAVGGTLTYRMIERGDPAPAGVVADAPAPATEPDAPEATAEWVAAFTLAKADIHLRPEEALGMRGAGDRTGRPTLDELARAIEPYRADDFEEAVRRLGALRAQYPAATRPSLYLGISLLFLDRPAEAVAPLEAAAQSDLPEVAADARWNLAVAYARLGDAAGAEREAAQLCTAGGADAARACAARDAIKSEALSPP